jgi:hypothetical protein
MRDFSPNPTAAPAESPSKAADRSAAERDAAGAGPVAEQAVVASHEALFAEAPSTRCDACGEPIAEAEGAEGYGIPGRGVYLWARGEETRLESVPLCASCASAIGMTALARWEIEEEEG